MALRKVGVIFTAEGYSQYMGELKQVNQEMRTMATQSKLAVAQLGNNSSTTDTYRTKMKSMGAEIQVSGQRTKMLTDLQKTLGAEQKRLPDMIEKSTQKYKESNETTKELRKSYTALAKAKGEDAEETLAAEKAYKSSLRETNNLKKEMKELEVVYNQNSKQLEKMPNDIAKAELATQRLTNAQQKLHTEYRNQGGWLADTAKGWDDFGNAAITTGDNLQKAGGYMTSRFTVPIIAGYTAATKIASDFHTQIGQLGPLLAEGGNITAEHRQQMDLLGESSRAWAIDYGKNTSDINTGMAELVRNGYSSAQVMGMIPNLLDASIASGEDFNAVMHTSANVLSQFQLRGKDTNETLANTQRVVDSLTYVANATSSGFGDLGAGMAYVGPVANTLNMSIEETASLLGILSDNGIEASQGGTALRGALTRLLKPSKQNAVAMDELGISVEDYQKGLIDFPTILDTIAENTKNLTDEQKASLIATAFGTEAQSAMNALVNAGGDELRNMTSAAEGASGATKEIAEAMKELPEFKFQQMWAEVRDLGIEVGTQLLPHVLTAVDTFGDWVSAFGDLDESTQGFIIKAGLAVAAIGPLATGLGSIAKIAGYTSKGISGIIRTIGKWTTPKAITDTTTELGKIPGAAGKAGGAAALFSNPWVIGGAVAIAGVSAFVAYMNHQANLPFAKHQESVDETNGAYQDWFDGVTAGIGTIDELNQSAIQGVTETTEAYVKALEDIRGANVDTQENLDKMFGENFFGGLELSMFAGNINPFDHLRQFRLEIDNVSTKMKEFGASSQEIEKVQVAFNNYGNLLANTQAETWRLFETEQKVTADWSSGQVKAIDTVTQAVVAGLDERKEARLAELDDQLKNQFISQETYEQEVSSINKHTTDIVSSIQKSTQSIKEVLSSASLENRALREDEVVSFAKSMTNIAKISGESLSTNQDVMDLLSDNMSLLTQKTSIESLARMGILDKESVAMLRNASTTEEALQIMIDALDRYGAEEIEPKNAYVETADAKVALMELAELVENWNNLTFEERLAQVETRGKDEIDELLELLGVDWNNLTPEQKRYYAEAEGGEALENILYLTGEWDRSTDPKTKYAILETQIDNEALLGAIEMRDLWNNADFMSLAMEIDTNAPDANAQLVNLVNYFAEQNGLPPLQMEAEALTEDAQQKLADLIAAYTGAPVEDVLEFLTSTNADETEAQIGAATEAHEEAGGVGTAEMDTSTNAPDTTGKLVTTGTTLGGLDGRSARVTVNLTDNATVRLQGVGGLISGLNGRVATTYVDTVRRGRAEFAEGGHISPFATGGHVMPAFATGGHIVPQNFQGLVGEAGPEIFTVSSRGVSITPLNSREKIRGIDGVLEDHVKKNGGPNGAGEQHSYNITINNPVVKDNMDVKTLARQIDKELGKIVSNRRKGRGV